MMRAVVYVGPGLVEVQDVPRPRLEKQNDVIVRVTSTAICGSDLHLYAGLVPTMKAGDVLGKTERDFFFPESYVSQPCSQVTSAWALSTKSAPRCRS